MKNKKKFQDLGKEITEIIKARIRIIGLEKKIDALERKEIQDMIRKKKAIAS